MIIDDGYMYHKSTQDIPIYCNKCGENLVEERYRCNSLARTTVKTTLTINTEKVKIRRYFLLWWKLFTDKNNRVYRPAPPPPPPINDSKRGENDA